MTHTHTHTPCKCFRRYQQNNSHYDLYITLHLTRFALFKIGKGKQDQFLGAPHILPFD